MREDIYYKDENQMCNKKKVRKRKGNYDTMNKMDVGFVIVACWLPL